MLFNSEARERPVTETLVSAHKAKVQSERARVTHFMESPRNYRRIGSSGSNLTCERLLLRMQAKGHGDALNQRSTLSSEPSFHNHIYDISLHFLQGKLATWRGFGLVGVKAKPDRTESSRRNRWHQRSPP
jgi:hypothetical protein